MEKKTIMIEIPCELIDKIDRLNNIGDRSNFVTDLLNKQIQPKTGIDSTTEFTTTMKDNKQNNSGEINLVTSNGNSLGKFDVNTVEGFEQLAQKIKEISNHPVVQIKAEKWK